MDPWDANQEIEVKLRLGRKFTEARLQRSRIFGAFG